MNHQMSRVRKLLAGAVGVLAITIALYGTASDGAAKEKGSAATGSDLQMLVRLTGDQYRNTIADIFGSDIKVEGRFDPETRIDGLLAIGSGETSISPSGAEQFLKMARSIAGEVVEEKHRDTLLPCKPKDPTKPDEACAKHTLSKYGRLLFRRPLTAAELNQQLATTRSATATLGDFYAGLELGLVAQLTSPQFLFIQGLRDRRDSRYFDDYGKAARLSYFLWNTTPDEQLLAAAEGGKLSNAEGRTRQVERLLASPRLEIGVRAFFSDFLDLQLAEVMAKDPVIYPQFAAGMGPDAKEETLKTLVDHLLVQKGDYRDLFTTRKTFLNRRLGSLYRVPVAAEQGWAPYEFVAGAPRAGILTQLSFLAPHSHPGRSSPTLRGKALRELLLCQEVPRPPPNVDFTNFDNADRAVFKTTRQRLDRHSSDPVCAGCHKITDPIGLALENFDGAGSFRMEENGEPIDATGSLDGRAYANVLGLGEAVRDNPQTAACMVQRLYGYGLRRKIRPDEEANIETFVSQFAADDYRFLKLLAGVANSDAFYRVTPSNK